MADIIEKALMLLSHDLELKGIDLMKEIDPELPMVECDFHQIQQALLNLLSNASESMSSGGKLHVTARKPDEDHFIEVVIEDTGSGIPEEDLTSTQRVTLGKLKRKLGRSNDPIFGD